MKIPKLLKRIGEIHHSFFRSDVGGGLLLAEVEGFTEKICNGHDFSRVAVKFKDNLIEFWQCEPDEKDNQATWRGAQLCFLTSHSYNLAELYNRISVTEKAKLSNVLRIIFNPAVFWVVDVPSILVKPS